MPDVVSPPTAAAAGKTLTACGVHSAEALRSRTLRETVQALLTRQGAELWASGASEPEEIPPDSDVLLRATAEPTVPALDTVQLGMAKAQLRTLVPAIHAVVDRAQSRAAGRARPRAPPCTREEAAGGGVERREPSSPDLLVESAVGQPPKLSSAPSSSAHSAAGGIGRYVGPSKVEARAEPAQREEGQPAVEWRVPPAAAAPSLIACPAWQSFRALA